MDGGGAFMEALLLDSSEDNDAYKRKKEVGPSNQVHGMVASDGQAPGG
jgi:hypothetical protein